VTEVAYLVLGVVVGAAVGAGVVFWAMRRSQAPPATDPPVPVAGAESVRAVEPVHPVTSEADARGMTEALDASDKVLTELEKRYRGRKAGRD
jgi:hypothetical protein